MTYRSLLVQLDEREGAAARTDLALRLARQFEAHLVGLAPTGRLVAPGGLGAGLLGLDTLTQALSRLRERAERRGAQFGERCRVAGLSSFEAVVDEEDSAVSTVHHGHCSDLVIVGQADPRAPDPASARAEVEQIVLYGARPTLVLPGAGRFDTVGDRVLVGWDDSREAARALADAMPLLCRARTVQVLQCDSPIGLPDVAARRRLDALQRWLAWHGVEADVRLEQTEIDIGSALLSRAADLSADLIVTGAYGHARWSERVLGGTTRTLLANMTVPVLMSH